MTSRNPDRPARPLPTRRARIAVGALAAGLGLTGLFGALTLHPHSASRSTASPYFICLAYTPAWGICIGPPLG